MKVDLNELSFLDSIYLVHNWIKINNGRVSINILGNL